MKDHVTFTTVEIGKRFIGHYQTETEICHQDPGSHQVEIAPLSVCKLGRISRKKKISAFVLFSATVVVLWWVGSQGSLLSFKRCTGKQTDGWQSWNESLTILIGLHGKMLVTGKIPCALVWSQWWQMIAQKGLLPLAINLVWYDAFRGELSFVFYLSTANVSDHAKQTNLRESK